MNYKWLQKQNNQKLIVFFNGWGMDFNAVSHLNCEDYDVVVLYDYNNLDTDCDVSNYKEKYVVGWSMGVMISTIKEVKKLTKNADKYIAICGTPYPINNNFGIPEKIYNLTIKGFNELSSKKFVSRMFSENNIPDKITERSLESQKSELIKLLEYKTTDDITFDKIIIAEHDVIIPTKNQINYWKDKNVSYELVPTGHYPFLLYNKWAELIE